MTKNWDELCDEEKSFNEWFQQNQSIVHPLVTSMIESYKKIYMQGYAAGFQAKLKYSSEESLQK
jgi:hypothetical protein